MAASFTLTLDTTPPVLTFGHIAPPQINNNLIVPFSINEESMIDATFTDLLGVVRPLTRVDGALVSFLGSDVPVGDLMITVHTVDPVGNAGTYSISIAINVFLATLYASQEAIMTFGFTEAARGLRITASAATAVLAHVQIVEAVLTRLEQALVDGTV